MQNEKKANKAVAKVMRITFLLYVTGVPPQCARRVRDRNENHGDGVPSGDGVFVFRRFW